MTQSLCSPRSSSSFTTKDMLFLRPDSIYQDECTNVGENFPRARVKVQAAEFDKKRQARRRIFRTGDSDKKSREELEGANCVITH
jgi:hypothetical protein